MKQQNIIQRLCLFLFVLVLAVPALAQKERGGGSTFSIGSAADWKTFCDRVNKGETTLNAKMTADIELNADIDLGQEIVMVGNQYHLYSGTFDGQGHTLTINWNTGTRVRVAPFESVENTTIKNLHVKGEIKSKGDGLSGLIANVYGTTTISGCIIEVNLKAKTILAGMVRWVISYGKLTITDCIVKGDFTVTKKGEIISGFVCRQYGNCTLTNCLYLGTNNANNNESYTFAGNNTEVKNCYYLNACGNKQGEQVTADQLKSGEVAYRLQAGRSENVWGQNLDTDNEPQLTADAAKRVRKVDFTYKNDVKATRYANDGKGIAAGMPTFTAKDLLGTGYNLHHYYTIALAEGFTASTPITADRTVAINLAEKDYYEIASKDNWKEFRDIVGNGQNAVDAKMTADVDLGSDIFMVGNSYAGTFDGQGHTLKINWNGGSDSDIAPFYTVKNATIKNLRVEGEIKSSTHFLSGLICNAYGTVTISGCVSAVNITSSYDKGGCDAAGMIECVRDNAKVTITDCLVKGKFTATTESGSRYMGGFVCNQYGTCTLTNCLYASENNATGGYTFASTYFSGTTLNNCYYLNLCGKAQGTQVTKEQLKSGEVAYLLQNKRAGNFWGQELGKENDPLPTDKAEKHVCKVDFSYNEQVKATRYATKGKAIFGDMPTVTPQFLLGSDYNSHHYYRYGFSEYFTASTPVNADRTVGLFIEDRDYYEIASKDDWRRFCDLVRDGQNGIDAKMTKDINLSSDFSMVGSDEHRYAGTFDGQGHTLTLNWNSVSARQLAPFQNVKGATIRNLRTEGYIKSNTYGLSGLIYSVDGATTISGCVSNVDLTSSYDKNAGCDASGMVHHVTSGASVEFTDCLVKGKFHATTDNGKKGMGGFVYGQYGTCKLTNCLYIGKNNATSNSYTFAKDATVKNCYYLNPCGEAQGTKVTEEQLKNGHVAKLLQAGRTDQCHWSQPLGEMPGLYCEADKSKTNYVYYDTANSRWACDDFRLTDGQPLPIGLDFTAANVTYERNFNGAQKATLCLPYDLYAQGFKAYTLSGGNKNEVHFKEVDDKLTAYTPYYITADGTPQLGGRNIEVKAYKADKMTTPAAGYKFTGTVAGVSNATAAADNAYILQDDGKFHKVTTTNSAATIPAYRAYIICPPQASGAKQLSVVLDGETTGIGSTTNEATDGKNGPVYDLQGRRVADRLDDARHRLPAGVYIVGGRKVVVK